MVILCLPFSIATKVFTNSKGAGTKRTVVLTDVNTPIDDGVLLPDDVQNNFTIVGLDFGDKATVDAYKALSINMSLDGTDFKLGCAIPFDAPLIHCGMGFRIDFHKKNIFDETTVTNVKGKTILTMTGRVTWE